MSKIREQITKELLIKQCKALYEAKGDTDKAAKKVGISYAGFLNRFRVSGLDYHVLRRKVLDGVSYSTAISGARLHESTKPSALETDIRAICRDEFRRMKMAA